MLNEFVLTKDSICPRQFVRLKFVRNLKVQNKTSDFFFLTNVYPFCTVLSLQMSRFPFLDREVCLLSQRGQISRPF